MSNLAWTAPAWNVERSENLRGTGVVLCMTAPPIVGASGIANERGKLIPMSYQDLVFGHPSESLVIFSPKVDNGVELDYKLLIIVVAQLHERNKAKPPAYV